MVAPGRPEWESLGTKPKLSVLLLLNSGRWFGTHLHEMARIRSVMDYHGRRLRPYRVAAANSLHSTNTQLER